MIKTDTLKNGYKILQDSERFQFGIDAVLLADYASKSLKEKESVIDLGTGTGIIPLLMVNKCKTAAFTGLEVQKESADMAARSVAMNGLEGQIQIVHGDLKEAGSLFPRHSFNVVTCNPPYMIDAHGRNNEQDALTIARHEVLCTLEDIVTAADYLLASHGSFFMIHRPFRLPEIFSSLEKHKMEMKRMRLIYPFADKEPNMVLIEARKNAKRRLTIEPPLIVRNDDGEYTIEVQDIYNK
ncbi:MAG: tRNA1(Val) (adenine(37)-N6)-methyltransferase [Treponema sp.]|nr:tRNA1(Val) (adenine(37)-N6)-methyltransferase [Treponema sp.]MDY5759113.1 tRNA1(Val) (adenine(37)-N6)-methyltransferase [Treponema sp.]